MRVGSNRRFGASCSLERRPSAPGQGGTRSNYPPHCLSQTCRIPGCLYDDPQGRYHLLHPQDLKVQNYPDGGIDLLEILPTDKMRFASNWWKHRRPRARPTGVRPFRRKEPDRGRVEAKRGKNRPRSGRMAPRVRLGRSQRKVFRMEAALIPSTLRRPSRPTAFTLTIDLSNFPATRS